MLDMIPLKVMRENRNIRVFIKYLIDETRKIIEPYWRYHNLLLINKIIILIA